MGLSVIGGEDSYAIRLYDNAAVETIKLVAVPIPLKLKTEEVHKEAVASPFYEKWVMEKPKHVFELIKAVENKEIASTATHAEEDTRRLRAVIMTGPNGTIAWEPETIKLMQLSKELQNNGIPAYYSIDTGPSVFFITSSEYAKEIKSAAEDVLNGKYPVLEDETLFIVADGMGGHRNYLGRALVKNIYYENQLLYIWKRVCLLLD